MRGARRPGGPGDGPRRRRPGVGHLRRNKSKACAEAGIDVRRPQAAGRRRREDELLALVARLNADAARRRHPRAAAAARRRSTRRTVIRVDRRRPRTSTASIPRTPVCSASGRPRSCPATPLGHHGAARRVRRRARRARRRSSSGRSNIVGKPMALLLLAAHATVTICHSRTRDLAARDARRRRARRRGRQGRARSRPDDGQARRAVIDVGMNRIDGGLVGDVDAGVARGGAGSHAGPGRRRPDDDRHALLRNTVRAARYRSRRACLPPGVGATCSRASVAGSAARLSGPSFVVKEEALAAGHREVVLEREGLRLHRA